MSDYMVTFRYEDEDRWPTFLIVQAGTRSTSGGADLVGFAAGTDLDTVSYIGIDELAVDELSRHVLGWHPVFLGEAGQLEPYIARIDTIEVSPI